MSRTAKTTYDMGLTMANLNAAVVLSLLGVLALWVVAGVGDRMWFASRPVVNLAKVAAARERIDPNTASVASLRRLPGIGCVRAQAIVQYRRGRSPAVFKCAADLQKIHGIGPGISRKVAHYLALPESK